MHGADHRAQGGRANQVLVGAMPFGRSLHLQLPAVVVGIVMEAHDGAVEVDRSPPGLNLVGCRLPHHPGSETGIAEGFDEGFDLSGTVAVIGWGAGRREARAAVVRDKPLMRCAAQSAAISVQGLPQTFSV